MKTVKVADVVIGEGVPKIIVPLVERKEAAILEEAKKLAQLDCDIIEWRIDFFEEVTNEKKVAELSKQLRECLNKPLLVTFRTKKEGGELELSDAQYFSIYEEVIASGSADLIDVELFMPSEASAKLIAKAQAQGVKIVMCNHDFHATPEQTEIVNRLKMMQEKGADICKIAVMPQSPADVLTLLAATEEMKRKYADRPLITMSMGALGMVSRVSGQTFGSDATFGAAAQASAPGQVPVGELRTILNTLKH
ncbi:type I 3-dehydroquinate dehydratase [Candidatus Enterococcus clewellii]|uniref:3-dehydroquinate dehydratase n=1 Tax=Candidatus Enterococcus clewellii TaxID=1834193 RepID=A0A242K394_9ENTE|nr:type I 3-dehydroquinate dehydratase [Enterococcus sp. 9E7_DIV0242]OTP13467.1 3-dehydroquinate dehydratase, type I [Enterococcus sp. 9E7_DIV0242]